MSEFGPPTRSRDGAFSSQLQPADGPRSRPQRWPWCCLALFLLVVGPIVAGFVVRAIFGEARSHVEHGLLSSPPIADAVEMTRRHPDVRVALGDTIEAGQVRGSVKTRNGKGRADVRIRLLGSRTSGYLELRTTIRPDGWTHELLEVTIDNRARRIDVLATSEESVR